MNIVIQGTRAELKAQIYRLLTLAVYERSGTLDRDCAKVRLLLRRYELAVEADSEDKYGEWQSLRDRF